MADLGKAYVQIVPSAEGIKGSITKVLSAESTSAGKSAGLNVAGAIKGAIVAAGIGEALKKSLTEGAALEQSLGGVETLFKDSADTVIKNANKAWETAGLSANQYMEQSTSFAASLLQSLGGDTKAAAQYADTAIIDMADNANKMGTAVENIQNAYQGFSKQNYTMLDNLKLGYGGTKTEMERLLADAGAISNKKYDISSLADVYEAIHVIQGELGITGTTSKEAAETLSGSLAAMQSAATNFMGNLSMRPGLVQKSLMELVNSAKTFLIGNLVPALGNVLSSVGNILGTLMQGDFVGKIMLALQGLSANILTYSSSFIEVGLGLIEKLATGIANGMPAIIKTLPKIVSNLADVINKNAPKIITTGVKIIKTLVVGIIKAMPTLVKALPQIAIAAAKAFMAFGWASLGKSAITLLKNGVLKIAGGIGSALRSRIANVKSAFTGPFTTAKNTVVNLVQGLINKVKGMFPFSISKLFSVAKLPKFSLNTGSKTFDGFGKVKYPTSITQHAEGGIFTKPTLLGSHLFGEAGAEGLIPLDTFWNKMDNIANNSNGGGVLNLVITLDGETIAKSTVDYVNGQTLRYGTSPLMV